MRMTSFPPGQAEKLLQLKRRMDGAEDVVMMPYCVSFDAAGRAIYSYYRERLLKRALRFIWEGAVHEVITPRGKILHADVEIHHKKIEKKRDSDRNLNIYRKLLEEKKELNPREQFYFASELYFHVLYEEAIETLEAFLNGRRGWIENNITACRYLHQCYRCTNRPQEALRTLFCSFEYDLPRAEVLCDIGSVYIELNRYEEAVYWYEKALSCVHGDTRGGFMEADCYDYIPYLQLCVCFDRMGLTKQAIDANERALRIKPESEAALGNRAYFLASRA